MRSSAIVDEQSSSVVECDNPREESLPSLGPQVLASAADPNVLRANLATLVGAGSHIVSGNRLVQERADLVIGSEYRRDRHLSLQTEA